MEAGVLRLGLLVEVRDVVLVVEVEELVILMFLSNLSLSISVWRGTM
jgi:hypothetical protein